jgi:hypothetical protein
MRRPPFLGAHGNGPRTIVLGNRAYKDAANAIGYAIATSFYGPIRAATRHLVTNPRHACIKSQAPTSHKTAATLEPGALGEAG